MEKPKYEVPKELIIPASEHPKAFEGPTLILNIIMCALGAIIGLELIVRTGVTPNTSIIGALFAIVLSRIPIAFCQKFRSVHRQNLIATSISGATFSAANCLLLPIGIPVVMGRPDLVFPMLIGVFIATVIDATILYRSFDSEMFPADGAWPPGVASAESILAVVEKGKKAFLMIVGIAIGWVGKLAGIPTDLLGVSWFGDFFAMLALGVGSIVIGFIKDNGFTLSLFGHGATLLSGLLPEGLSATSMITYMPHGVMIGAGAVSLIQCAIMLVKKSKSVYLIGSLVLALGCGILTDMSPVKLIIWLLYTAFAAIASELIVGISAMHSGWFPGFATALIFLLVGMLIGFPPIPLALMVGYTSATGPAFSDMAYDLKSGYILRGSGVDPELEMAGRKQQYRANIFSFVVALIIVIFMVNRYFDQGLFAPVSATFAATIDAGTNAEIAKWLFIWAIPGAIIQFIGGERQIGILFATGLLVGTTMNGVTILIGLLIRHFLLKQNAEHEQTLNILGAGALAGAALCSFFTATLGLFNKKS